MNCERCGKKQIMLGWELFDYCLHCGKNLCDKCMEKGCCGKVPADSGADEDNYDEDNGKDRK